MAHLPSLTPNPPPGNPLAALLGHQSSPLSPAALQGLAELISKLPRRGKYYVDKTIELDGLVFEECSFENCTFITKTGDFTIRNCRIYGPKTAMFFSGAAKKAVNLIELMHASYTSPVYFPQLYPVVHYDGRISIE